MQQIRFMNGQLIPTNSDSAIAEADQQVDRISKLPDAILCDILSHLSTKEAVATSILSRRWESVWTKVPVIKITMDYGNSSKGFKAFVDRVLMCNDSPTLRRFKLIVSSRDVTIKDYHYHSWIRNIMQRKVVKIDLVRVISWGNLPAGSFSNEKLKVLKLTGFAFPRWDPVHLPNLLTLHFKSITFKDGSSLNKFLMSLPRLEELAIKKCDGLKNTCVCSSSLKRLKITNTLMCSGENGMSTIDCPSLIYLHIYDSSRYKFGNMPSLTEARLHLGFKREGQYTIRVISLLNQVSSIKTLILDVATKEPAPGYTEPDQLPLFPSLTHLTVSYDNSSTNCSHFSWRHLVVWILQRAPNIISFDYMSESGKHGKIINYREYLPQLRQIDRNTYYLHQDQRMRAEGPIWLPLPPLPLPVLPTSLTKCIIPTLEVVNANLTEVADADKILLEYLLKNGVNLKVVNINLKAKGSEVTGSTMDAIGWLYEVPWASSECQLLFSSP